MSTQAPKRWKDSWRNVPVHPDVKKCISIMALNDDIQENELVRRLVEAEVARRADQAQRGSGRGKPN